ncbi:MAG TPA: antitoxin Xre/MbcA/ParS toxin-binding domain-containing protein [Egibacteraceae bacterium]|nr:antitoxin Xre/MbcA/ParS toxin-binding domain-containing protein [Egibacteraceae bacterium]
MELPAWMTTPSQALGGRTSADALADGDVDHVVAILDYA